MCLTFIPSGLFSFVDGVKIFSQYLLGRVQYVATPSQVLLQLHEFKSFDRSRRQKEDTDCSSNASYSKFAMANMLGPRVYPIEMQDSKLLAQAVSYTHILAH